MYPEFDGAAFISQGLSFEEIGPGLLIEAGKPIPFKNLIDQDGPVTYDHDTCIFTLEKAGTYQVTWEIPVEATDVHDELYLQLLSSTKAPLTTPDLAVHTQTYAPLPINVSTGSAIVKARDFTEIQLRIAPYLDKVTDWIRITNNANITIAQLGG
jgi:hypothetical protein